MGVALAWILAGGIAAAQNAPAGDAAPQNSIKLSRVLADLPAGTPYMSFVVGGSFCIGKRVNKTWTDGRQTQQISPFRPAFKTELTSAGYKVITPGEDNLFDESAATADYEVAAVITGENLEGCMSKGNLFSDRGIHAAPVH